MLWEPVNRAYGKRGYVSLKRVKGRPMLFLLVICLVFIEHQPFLYLTAISPRFSACIGTISALATVSGIFVTKHYAEIYGFFGLSPGVGYALGGPLITPTYNMTGPYNIAWIVAAALSIVMTALLLYSYRGSRICIKGQEKTGNTAEIQCNNGRMC